MAQQDFPPEFLEFIQSIEAKRPRTVIQHILEHGYITTEELTNLYGYAHPPRAARDVRELGIPLETFKVKAKDGRTIGAYKFGDPAALRLLSGRRTFSKDFKQRLMALRGSRCAITLQELEERELQIDHRIPYQVAGDQVEFVPEEFMLLSGSSNRAKSWTCEHCENWLKLKDPDICRTCYWAYPESYAHVAMVSVRRTDIVWSGDEVANYEAIQQSAQLAGVSIQEFIKSILNKQLSDKD